MKITRIVKAKQYRIFRNFTWPAGLPDFARFNLIYGWNGAGKTTLSGLFTYLQTKQSIVEGEVQFRIDDRLVGQADIPNAVLPQVRVFNRDTIKRSVFESAKDSLPPVYYLGEDSADKQARVEQLQVLHAEQSLAKAAVDQDRIQAERGFETFCTDQARAIKNLLTAAGSEFNTYNAGKFKQRAEALVASQPLVRLSQAEIDSYLATKSSTIRASIPVPHANYPDFISLTSRVSAILGKSIVASTIDELTSDQSLSSWVRAGLELHRREHGSTHCRFCEQPIPVGRLERLEAHFNDAFNRFQAELAGLLSEVRSSKQFVSSLSVPDKGLLYENLVSEYETATVSLNQHSTLVIRFLDAVIAALEVKAGNPFQLVDLHTFVASGGIESTNSGGLMKLLEVLVTAGTAISTYIGKKAFDQTCEIIQKHNQHSAQFESAQREARRALETEEIAKVIENYVDQQTEIRRLISEDRRLNEVLTDIARDVRQLNVEIRQHFKAAEELTTDMASYLGREELQFTAHDGGYSITRNGQPALHLSEGERTAVSFIYFLKSLEDTDFNLQTGVVIVDDPVSSLDANSIYCAFGFMKSRLKESGQLFVLTHNFTLFRQVKNWFHHVRPKTDSSFYMLKPVEDAGTRTATISPLDPMLREHESEYHYLFQATLDASRLPEGTPMAAYYGMSNVARRLIETVLAFKFPDKAGELQKQLDEVSGFDDAKKARIIRFTHSYSHLGIVSEPEHDLSILGEARGILIDVMELIKSVDESHYNKMIGMCS